MVPSVVVPTKERTEIMTSTTTDHQSPDRIATSQQQASSAVEREDLISSLGHAPHFVRYPARDLAEDQVRLRTTARSLCPGDLIKHVTAVEPRWSGFMADGD